jgi:hypothetical protein
VERHRERVEEGMQWAVEGEIGRPYGRKRRTVFQDVDIQNRRGALNVVHSGRLHEKVKEEGDRMRTLEGKTTSGRGDERMVGEDKQPGKVDGPATALQDVLQLAIGFQRRREGELNRLVARTVHC